MALTTTIHKIERKMIPRNPSANRKKLLLNNSMLPIIAQDPSLLSTQLSNKKHTNFTSVFLETRSKLYVFRVFTEVVTTIAALRRKKNPDIRMDT